MLKSLAATALVLASGSALATTNIDIAFMVTQKTLDTYGYEAVYNKLNDQVNYANQAYNKAIPGLDVSFNLKIVQPYDGALSENTNGCANNGKYNAYLGAASLINNGHYKKGPSYIDIGGIDTCYTTTDQNVITEAGVNSGADFVVMVDSLTDGNIIATADPQIAITMHYPKLTSWTLAHEMGHLLGLIDLYDNTSYDCSGAEAGRLMCGSATTPSYDTSASATALFSDSERSVVKNMLNITDRVPSDVSIIGVDEIIGAGAGLAAARDAGDRTVTISSVDASTLTESNPKATFTVTMSSASTEPVVVNVYSQGNTATAGTEYLDNVAQVITLDAGETSKTFSLTSNKLDSFTGTKTVTVGVRSAAGATAVDAPTTITLTGSAKSSNNGTSGSSSGGGSAGFGVLTLLAVATTLRRKWHH